MKKKSPENQFEELKTALYSDYERWKDIYENGCSDPCWSDGSNLELVRNHILYDKQALSDFCMFHNISFICLPDEFFFPEPPIMPKDFMGNSREIVCRLRNRCGREKTYFEIMQRPFSYFIA